MPLVVGQTLYGDDFFTAESTPSYMPDGTALKDHTDATYIDLTSISETTLPPFGRFDGTISDLDTADPGHPGTPVLIQLWIRAQAARPVTPPNEVACVARVIMPTQFNIALNMLIPADGDIHEVTVDVTDANYYSFDGNTIADVMGDLESGPCSIRLSNAIYGSGDPQTSRVYEWQLRILYEGASVRPIRRVFPRPHPGRTYPADPSIQGGRRSGGSTYL